MSWLEFSLKQSVISGFFLSSLQNLFHYLYENAGNQVTLPRASGVSYYPHYPHYPFSHFFVDQVSESLKHLPSIKLNSYQLKLF